MWSDAGAPPMPCPPLLEGDSLLNLEMLDVAEKDPADPVPVSAPASLLQSLKRRNRSYRDPEEAAHLMGGLDLIWGRFSAVPPGFACSQGN